MFTKRSTSATRKTETKLLSKLQKVGYINLQTYIYSKATKYAQNPFIMTFNWESEFVFDKI